MADIICPGREILHQYSLGLLSGEQRDNLESHLDACPECQATIVTLDDGGDTLVGHLRLPVSGESVLAEPQLQDALAAALAMPGKMHAAGETPGAAGQIAPDVPATLGEYQVLEELGHGGMGRVYKALQTKLDRVVAVKVLPRGRLRDQKAIVRFEREMKAIGRLAHPNIVQAYDAREIQQMPVLVMEFVDGLDLSELVRRVGPLPMADACELVRQTALALQYAHEHGLVHRDIKPSNIMLARSGEVKLLDLGLARFYAESTAGISEGATGVSPVPSADAGETPLLPDMTGTDQLMGTADYMAPEQASDSRRVDIRADLYSLGCTLYKLLSGRAPFSGPGHHTTLEKLNAQVHEQPPFIRTLVPQVPEKLAALLDRMLAKDPADRFGTPAAVAEALAPWCGDADLPPLLRRAEASLSPALDPQASEGEANDFPQPLAASRRGRWAFRLVVLLLLLGGFGSALGILLTITKDGKQTTVEVPEGSRTAIDTKGNVTVKLPEATPAAGEERQAFVVGNSPYYQALTEMAVQKGMTVEQSFNCQYDQWLPAAKGHLLLVETHDGVPIVPPAVLDKFYPQASDGLKAPNGVVTVGATRIVFVDFSRQLNKPLGDRASVSKERQAFVVGNSPYYQALTEMARQKGMTVEQSFNCQYDQWLPAAKGHVLLVETHDGVPIVPPAVLEKYYPHACDGLKTPDGATTVGATRIVFIDFSRLADSFAAPGGSRTTINSRGNTAVDLGGKMPETATQQQQAFVAGRSPYVQILTDMAQRKGMTVSLSFNDNYDNSLPLAKGHVLIVETHNGVPIAPVSLLEKYFPGASLGLKSFTGAVSVGGTEIFLVDFARLLNKSVIDSIGTDSGHQLAFVVGRFPYYLALRDAARQKGITVQSGFNYKYDEFLPQAKRHVLFVETHDGVPIVPLGVLDKFFPKASDGLKRPDGVTTVGKTAIVFVDFSLGSSF